GRTAGDLGAPRTDRGHHHADRERQRIDDRDRLADGAGRRGPAARAVRPALTASAPATPPAGAAIPDAAGEELTDRAQRLCGGRAERPVSRAFLLARALYCCANMKAFPQVAAAVALAMAALAPGARAEEPSRFGMSLDGYAAPVWDNSVTS